MSNYPDNIHDYDNTPGSPFYQEPYDVCPNCENEYEESSGFQSVFLTVRYDEERAFCCEHCANSAEAEEDEPETVEEFIARGERIQHFKSYAPDIKECSCGCRGNLATHEANYDE
jgi:hypothetical protein